MFQESGDSPESERYKAVKDRRRSWSFVPEEAAVQGMSPWLHGRHYTTWRLLLKRLQDNSVSHMDNCTILNLRNKCAVMFKDCWFLHF
jgi:hypothetical protein